MLAFVFLGNMSFTLKLVHATSLIVTLYKRSQKAGLLNIIVSGYIANIAGEIYIDLYIVFA